MVKDETDDGLNGFINGNGFGFYSAIQNATFSIRTPNSNSVSGPILAAQCVHIVGTYDGANMNIYINGVLKETKTKTGTITGFDSDHILGYTNLLYWAGSIDELYIYNRALSQAEVTQLYNLK